MKHIFEIKSFEKLSGSRRALTKEWQTTKIGVDTTEKEPSRVPECQPPDYPPPPHSFVSSSDGHGVLPAQEELTLRGHDPRGVADLLRNV